LGTFVGVARSGPAAGWPNIADRRYRLAEIVIMRFSPL
jgi:hypothetical protein